MRGDRREIRYIRERMGRDGTHRGSMGRRDMDRDRMLDGRRRRDSKGRYTRDRGMDDRTYEQRDRMMYPYPPMNDYPDYGYRDYSDYNYDERDYGDCEEQYYEDLEKWCKKLKKYDKFNLSKEDIISQARAMGADFNDYDEDEFVVTYYMMQSDHPNAYSNYQGFLALAKDFLEDDDVERKGSEKLCAYMYSIVKGE